MFSSFLQQQLVIGGATTSVTAIKEHYRYYYDNTHCCSTVVRCAFTTYWYSCGWRGSYSCGYRAAVEINYYYSYCSWVFFHSRDKSTVLVDNCLSGTQFLVVRVSGVTKKI